MELLRKKFIRKDQAYCEIVWQSGRSELCDTEFSEVFDVPEGVKTVWLSLHNRPAKNRYKVKINKYLDFPEIVFEDGYEFDNYFLNKILMPFCGKTLYLQCEYYKGLRKWNW